MASTDELYREMYPADGLVRRTQPAGQRMLGTLMRSPIRATLAAVILTAGTAWAAAFDFNPPPNGRTEELADSAAFSLVVARFLQQHTGPVRIDPAPPVHLGAAAATRRTGLGSTDEQLLRKRRAHLASLGVPEDSLERALGCVLSGLETPAERERVREGCPEWAPYSGLAVELPTRTESNLKPTGLVGIMGPWRVRAVEYAVHPTQRRSWAVYDYYLSPCERSWRVVGRSTVVHAN
jgi:hypothetical protein